MLFNSYIFIFGFLPMTFVLFWYCGQSLKWRLLLLTGASYAFYSWWQFNSLDELIGTFRIHSVNDLLDSLWKWRFTLIMFVSSSVDYAAAKLIVHSSPNQMRRRALLLSLSLSANLGLLGFFKYFGFFSQIASDINQYLGGGELPVMSMLLPVGISFYTFESMSYVIDIYRGVASPAKSYLDYACFIAFFPHLIAGPIIRYSDILHQFRDVNWVRPRPDWTQVNIGWLFFSAGLFKKLLIADPLAVRITPLWNDFSYGNSLGVVGSWAAVLGYTFRIYFDFSGYSDMAVGLGHLFGVQLPQNFNSPYMATDPIDFWRRWHISLSTWLRDYLYIPLGGNRNGKRARNLVITMLLGGLWHGAAWLFVLWGAWHGVLLVVFHVLQARGMLLSNNHLLGQWINRLITFLLVTIGWVFFRAADVNTSSYGPTSIAPAFQMLSQMAGANGFSPDPSVRMIGMGFWAFIVMCWVWCNFAPNTSQVIYGTHLRLQHAMLGGAVLAACVLRLGTPVDFLYFRF